MKYNDDVNSEIKSINQDPLDKIFRFFFSFSSLWRFLSVNKVPRQVQHI